MISIKKYSQKLSCQQVKMFFLIMSLLVIVVCACGSENNGRGTRAIGMANAFTAISDNSWSVSYNPAGLSFINQFIFSVFYVPAQYGLQELQTKALSAIIPNDIINIGVAVERFGFDLYSETNFCLATSFNINDFIALGISCNLLNINIKEYGGTKNIILNGGALARLSNNLTTGFSVHNFTRTKVAQINEPLPQVVNYGICWSPIELTKISFDVEKEIRYSESYKVGFEHIIFDVLSLRCGAANNPDKYSVGFAITYSNYEFSYAGYSHSELGWTHQIELSFYFNYKNND